MFRNRKLEIMRQHFWAHMMKTCPTLYAWCDKHLHIDTLPF